MIVITAPAGNIGGQVLAQVVKGSEPIRVIARDPDRIPAMLRQKVEVFVGSHGDHDVVSRAFDGAHSVFWLPPGDRTESSARAAYVDFSRPGCEAMRACGVKRVVGVSALGRGWPRPAGHVTATLELDDMIAQTGVHYRALACASLMENLLRQIDGIAETGVFHWPSPADLAMPAVATRDVASVAADLLLDPAWSGVDAIPMMGPQDISFGEMAATMSAVLSRHVRFQEMTMQDMHGMTLRRGASAGMAQAMVDMLTAKNEGMDHLVDRPVPNPATTDFRAWCVDVLAPAIAARP
ncbi:NAD(P)H-binding protein [Azospirillum sp. RWY-5-1]|uniref:NAD(P)H-binding protein n=1 Tax=Azospirillum oleiclasticum TaxID=2735135 RepID=A0ABX2TJL3_9PROT|nr:NAD(P)H-binding protein [Azospirillum oleiclasticum]NYZ17017.1 NAD(P)H-binding protein [Azospirillum oleiclasticum]NYZ24539.1 NAD(P)H-binding protein [Azospirillum oleiclasticum]